MDNDKKLKEIFIDNFDDEDEKELPKWLNTDDDLDSSLLDDFNPIGTIGDDPLKSTKKQKIKDILVDAFEDVIKPSLKPQPAEQKTAPIPKPNIPQAKPVQPVPAVLFDEKEDFEEPNAVKTDFDLHHIQSLIESALYVCGNEGVSLNDLKRLTDLPAQEIKKILKDWTATLDGDVNRGVTIKLFGEKYKFFSKPNNREELSKLITIKYRNPLSNKVMETLAIIAYNQPCTKMIIQDIRGKDPTMSIQKLIDLGLVLEAGRGDGPGRPLLYTVTHKFYDIFGIKNLNELPAINLDEPFHDGSISFFDTNRFND